MNILQNNKITALLDYVFYRIAKFYIKHKEEFEWHSGFFYVSGLFAFWSLSIIFVIIGIVGVNLSSNSQTVLIISVFLISFGVFHKRYTDRKLYEKLCKKYKNESNSRIKGVIVVLVCLMSFCIFILSVMFEVGFFSKH